MYKLYGIKITYTPSYSRGEPDEHIERNLVATFDTVEQAEKYVEAARLKNRMIRTWRNDCFNKKSLLVGCGDYEIERYNEDSVPHNPEINR